MASAQAILLDFLESDDREGENYANLIKKIGGSSIRKDKAAPKSFLLARSHIKKPQGSQPLWGNVSDPPRIQAKSDLFSQTSRFSASLRGARPSSSYSAK